MNHNLHLQLILRRILAQYPRNTKAAFLPNFHLSDYMRLHLNPNKFLKKLQAEEINQEDSIGNIHVRKKNSRC